MNIVSKKFVLEKDIIYILVLLEIILFYWRLYCDVCEIIIKFGSCLK